MSERSRDRKQVKDGLRRCYESLLAAKAAGEGEYDGYRRGSWEDNAATNWHEAEPALKRLGYDQRALIDLYTGLERKAWLGYC